MWRCDPMRVLLFIFAASAVFGQSRSQNWKFCASNDPARSIAGCSAIIEAGQETVTNLARAFDSRGLAYARRHDFDRAIQEYNKSLQLDSNSATAHYNRGVAYEFKGDYERAFPDLDEAVRLTPQDPDSYFCRGLAFEHKGEYDNAIEDFNQVLRLNPIYAAAFYNRALSYAHKRDYVRAAADYGRWRRLRAGRPGSLQLFVVLVLLGCAIGSLWRLSPLGSGTAGDQSHFTSLFSDKGTGSNNSDADLIDQL